MADQTVRLADPVLRAALTAAADPEGRIPRALAELGPVDGRDCLLLDPDDGLRAAQLTAAGAHVTGVALDALAGVPDASVDVAVACWNAIAPGEPAAEVEIAHLLRILRPEGRILVVHDYGKDDITPLLGPVPAARAAWGTPRGPFLANGFKVRVLHCWWSWDSLDAAAGFLGAAFGEAGAAVAAGMRRPRLAWKVAVYHRDRTLQPYIPKKKRAA